MNFTVKMQSICMLPQQTELCISPHLINGRADVPAAFASPASMPYKWLVLASHDDASNIAVVDSVLSFLFLLMIVSTLCQALLCYWVQWQHMACSCTQ